MHKYAQETIEIVRSNDWQSIIDEEINRLLRSGMVDQESHNRGILIGIALENIADNYLRGEKSTKAYKNLKRV